MNPRPGLVGCFLFGLVVGVPLRAWSGGDLCSGSASICSGSLAYDVAHLRVTSLTVDDVARPSEAEGWLTVGDGHDDAFLVGPMPRVDGDVDGGPRAVRVERVSP